MVELMDTIGLNELLTGLMVSILQHPQKLNACDGISENGAIDSFSINGALN